jgi:hypothetical protein
VPREGKRAAERSRRAAVAFFPRAISLSETNELPQAKTKSSIDVDRMLVRSTLVLYRKSLRSLNFIVAIFNESAVNNLV